VAVIEAKYKAGITLYQLRQVYKQNQIHYTKPQKVKLSKFNNLILERQRFSFANKLTSLIQLNKSIIYIGK
jgi:hypothetical protein